jgi:DNA repair photolyase
MQVKEVSCRQALVKSKITDYCLNPYTGCEHGCAYCYARFMQRYSPHVGDWGTWVDVKRNAPEVLAKQLVKARKGVVWASSVTDPYQPVEARYQLTRKCLEVLVNAEWPVSILTKSALVARDTDVIRQGKVDVGLSVNGLAEKDRLLWEPRASPHRARVDALKRLHDEGVPTYAFVGATLPGLVDPVAVLEEVRFVDSAFVEQLRFSAAPDNISRVVDAHYPELKSLYPAPDSYWRKVRADVAQAAKRLGMKVTYVAHGA